MILIKLFVAFFKIGAFTFGGGYAMIPLIQAEIVDKNKWLSNEEFMDTIAIAQSAPGAIAINTSIIVGYRIKRTLGALTCMFAVAIPSFIVILVIAAFFYKFKNNRIVEKIFLGVRPAVVALIALATYKFSKSIGFSKKTAIVSLLTLVSVVMFNVNPIILIILAAVVAVGIFRVNQMIREQTDVD